MAEHQAQFVHGASASLTKSDFLIQRFFFGFTLSVRKIEKKMSKFKSGMKRSFQRITPIQACNETRTRLKPPILTVWVFSGGVWSSLSDEQISRLWAPNDKNRSLCNLLFRDVFGLSEKEYVKFRRQLDFSGLTGIYKRAEGRYTIIVELDKPNRPIVKAAVAAGVIAAGLVAYNQRDRLKSPFETPDYAKIPFFARPVLDRIGFVNFGEFGEFQADDYKSVCYNEALGIADPSGVGQPENYNPVCYDKGLSGGTLMVMLAFYYFKILPAHVRNKVFLCNGIILYKPYEIMQRITNAEKFITNRKIFHDAINSFLDAVPDTAAMGICCISMPKHATMLVFDVVNKRLEFYDPNGRNASYHELADPTRTLYAYFDRNARHLKMLHPRVCKIWAPDYQFQKEKTTCVLWSVGIAICRMAGIERSQLPITIEQIAAISNAVLKSLLVTCQFSLFANKSFNATEVDRALDECSVLNRDEITRLVLSCKTNEQPIPTDVDVCGDLHREPIHCDDVQVDEYVYKIDVAALITLCPNMKSITYHGNPSIAPFELFELTNLIIFRPRSTFVSLNFDCNNIVRAMDMFKELNVYFEVGFVDLSKPSVVDSKRWAKIRKRITIGRVLVVGSLPHTYRKKMSRLSEITTPYVYLTDKDIGTRKTKSPFKHFVVFTRLTRDNWDRLKTQDVYDGLAEFESGIKAVRNF